MKKEQRKVQLNEKIKNTLLEIQYKTLIFTY